MKTRHARAYSFADQDPKTLHPGRSLIVSPARAPAPYLNGMTDDIEGGYYVLLQHVDRAALACARPMPMRVGSCLVEPYRRQMKIAAQATNMLRTCSC
jgi:hypothetical protein